MPATCAAGPDGVVDGPRGDTGVPGRRSGCCDAAGSPSALLVALGTLGGLLGPRRVRRRTLPRAG
jgi:hypothetical protein